MGTALLVAGYDLDGTALAASASHLLGEIGEALLATGTAWKVRRIDGTSGIDRASLKRSIAELAADDAEVALLVVLGSIVQRATGPALVTGAAHREYPDDATVELAWIGDRLRAARAGRVCAVVSARADEPRYAEWLAPLGSDRQDLIAVHAPTGPTMPLADALLDGLYGEAIDPATGTITVKSLGDHLARSVPEAALRASTASLTIASSPPLDRMSKLWDLRRSQLAARARLVPRTETDLAGSVLPGRFRIDALIARGTFGTVYRAHQLAIERDVAIKVLHADIDPTSDDGRLFVQEITSVGRIDHRGVVRIYQADITHDGRLFFAMELLAGSDLQTLGVVGGDRAIVLVRALLAGLGAAHDAGLVHADVKPANAIVDAQDRVVLVDFGLARLRPDRGAATSVGGTPAFMAPEQLADGRVDARSDLFSAALVLQYLATGWRRTTAKALAPPDDEVAKLPAAIRPAMQRAFAIDPAQRFATAGEFAEALDGRAIASIEAIAPVRRLPFHHLAPLTDHVFGRERDLAILVDHVLFGRSVIYTAPSGTGKTSLLRAGLVPRLAALGKRVAYVVARDELVVPDDAEIVVFDQAEAALDAIAKLRRDVTLVIAVREDHLARAIEVAPTLPVLRLPPLSRDGAKAAIVGPLAEARLAIEPELLDALLADLQRATSTNTVYPPNLQLACTVLCRELAPGDTVLTLAQYRALGGFDAIVAEYLERVLDGELVDRRATIARDLLVALVTEDRERATRPEPELLEIVDAPAPEIHAVLEVLRDRGILVRRHEGWELVHDSLVPRVLAWLERRDLARRRAVELVRFCVRRSRLLDRRELREIRPYAAAIAELDAAHRDLVARSARALRRRAAAVATAVVAVAAIGGVSLYRTRVAEADAIRERSLRDRDMGRFTLRLEPFDWNPITRTATPVALAALPDLAWTLHYVDLADPESPGPPFTADHLERDSTDVIVARGGRAFIIVDGRGRGERCPPSTLRIAQLPGYEQRDQRREVHVRIPTCAASRADMIDIPAGPFIASGHGEPTTEYVKALAPDEMRPEATVDLPAYAIDRLEVSNAAFALVGGGDSGIQPPVYPNSRGLEVSPEASRPATGLAWATARAYCAAFGKQLPTSDEWMKAMRGGLTVDGVPNPRPRRNYPWGTDEVPPAIAVHRSGDSSAVPVGTTPEDRSPYGVLDLAGNVSEWTRSLVIDHQPGMRVAHGGNFIETSPEGTDPQALASYMAIENSRLEIIPNFGLGMRCVSERPLAPPATPAAHR